MGNLKIWPETTFNPNWLMTDLALARKLFELAQERELTPEDFECDKWNDAYFRMREAKYMAYRFEAQLSDDDRRVIEVIYSLTQFRFAENVTGKAKGKILSESNWERYGAYMYSTAWAEKRVEALERAKHKCQLCGTRRRVLHVHHNSYVNLGHEPPEDLIVLCERCHKHFHGYKVVDVEE